MDWTAVTVALIAAVPATLGGWWAYGARKHARNTDNAVNHVPDGTPPLVTRVGQMEPKVDYLVAGVTEIARVVGVKLPPPPKDNA